MDGISGIFLQACGFDRQGSPSAISREQESMGPIFQCVQIGLKILDFAKNGRKV